MILIIGVKFRKSGKIYYFDPSGFDIKKGDHVIVETARGVEYGTVIIEPRNVTDDKVIQPLKPVIRLATVEDDNINKENEENEKEAINICFEKIKKHNLVMKLIDCEYTFDRNKLLFYFTAEGRIDFRELVKDLASIFRTRIELRQIGVRDETKLMGGIGICGRPLCCHTYLTDFVPVSIKMAKEQNLSLNPAKISGVCGRLMCCLKNEEEAYEYLNNTLPHINTEVKTIDGYNGIVQSVSVLKQRVKVIITKENDEKEIHEYHTNELTFEKKDNFSDSSPVVPPLPDEELDENALNELKAMELDDIEELLEESTEQTPYKHNKKSYSKQNHGSYGKGNYNSNSGTRRKSYNSDEQKEAHYSSHNKSNDSKFFREKYNSKLSKNQHKSNESRRHNKRNTNYYK